MIYRFQLLSPDELKRIQYKFDGCTHWNSGKVQLNGESVEDGQVKSNKFIDQHSSEYNYCIEIVNKALQKSNRFKTTYAMKDITQPMLTEYEVGGHYDLHIDSVEINNLRTDHSMTLFLNEPSEYEGGELVLNLSDVEYRVKEPAGMLVIYPTGLLHEVTEVTSGYRRVAIMWSQSLIDDYLLRAQVIDLGRAIGNVTHWCNKNNVDAKTTQNLLVPLEQVRNNFLREYGSFK